jgi:hypothetical protein
MILLGGNETLAASHLYYESTQVSVGIPLLLAGQTVPDGVLAPLSVAGVLLSELVSVLAVRPGCGCLSVLDRITSIVDSRSVREVLCPVVPGVSVEVSHLFSRGSGPEEGLRHKGVDQNAAVATAGAIS